MISLGIWSAFLARGEERSLRFAYGLINKSTRGPLPYQRPDWSGPPVTDGPGLGALLQGAELCKVHAAQRGSECSEASLARTPAISDSALGSEGRTHTAGRGARVRNTHEIDQATPSTPNGQAQHVREVTPAPPWVQNATGSEVQSQHQLQPGPTALSPGGCGKRGSATIPVPTRALARALARRPALGLRLAPVHPHPPRRPGRGAAGSYLYICTRGHSGPARRPAGS